MGPNPERGCASQPRVAVLGYPGTPDRDGSQPQRGCASAPGDDERAGLCNTYSRPQPLRGCREMMASATQPSPRVAEYGNPGLKDGTPSGLPQLMDSTTPRHPHPG